MTDALQRIRESDITVLGFAYCDDAGLPWLSWPLQTPEMSLDDWIRWVVRAVAAAPVCARTEADCWRELHRIDHAGLARVLARIAPCC